MTDEGKPLKSTPILDWLLEEQLKTQDALGQVTETHAAAINALAAGLARLEERLGGVDGSLRRELEALRTAAAAAVEQIEALGEGHEVREIRHVVRDGNGDIASIVSTSPPASETP